MTALVTGVAGGIGGAIVTKLRAEGFEVKELDLVSGFDVSDPEAWEHVGSVDLACLNAGIVTGSDDIATLRDVTPRALRALRLLGVTHVLQGATGRAATPPYELEPAPEPLDVADLAEIHRGR